MRVIFSTAPPAVAPDLVRTLVQERLVACGNVIPGVRSFYWWEGEVQDDEEVVLFMETAAERVEAMIGAPLDQLAAQGLLRDDVDRPALVEWIRRLVNALVVFPQPRARGASARRRFVADFLIPSICRSAAEFPKIGAP